ncbi:hypothetical protein MBANPS3_008294 [Mucor bainieri]
MFSSFQLTTATTTATTAATTAASLSAGSSVSAGPSDSPHPVDPVNDPAHTRSRRYTAQDVSMLIGLYEINKALWDQLTEDYNQHQLQVPVNQRTFRTGRALSDKFDSLKSSCQSLLVKKNCTGAGGGLVTDMVYFVVILHDQ